MNAKKFILDWLNRVTYKSKPASWEWVNLLMMAVDERAELNKHQSSLLEKVLGEASCKMRCHKDGKTPDDVFIIAAWINTANILPDMRI